MAKTVTVEAAETQLDALIDLAEQGEEIVIAKNDQAKVKLVPIAVKKKGKRVFGRYQGNIWVSDDFNQPLPDELWFDANP